jgi:hypothetical protein
MHLDISDAYAQLSEYRALELTESLKFCCAKKQHKKLAKQLERLVQGCKTEESRYKTTRRATCSMRVACFCTSSISSPLSCILVLVLLILVQVFQGNLSEERASSWTMDMLLYELYKLPSEVRLVRGYTTEGSL